MMKWEAPVVKELNVQETAGGQSDMQIECYCGCPRVASHNQTIRGGVSLLCNFCTKLW